MKELIEFQENHGDTDPIGVRAVDVLQKIEIQTDDDAVALGSHRVQLRERLRAVEAEQEKIAAPNREIKRAADKAIRATNTFFGNFSAPLLEAIRMIDGKLAGWEHSKALERREAERVAQAALKAAQPEIAAEALQASVAEAPRAEGLQKRETYLAEVVDLPAFLRAAAGSLELAQLVTVRMPELHKAARAVREEGPLEGFPGVRVVKKITFAS